MLPVNRPAERKVFMTVTLIIIVCSLCMAFLFSQATALTLCLAASCMLLPLLMDRPHLYFFFFILTRPLYDLASEVRWFAGMNIAGFSTLILAALCGLLLLQEDARRRIRHSVFLRRFNTLYGIFLLIGVASMAYSPDRSVSIADFLRLVTVGIVFNYCAVFFGEEKRLRVLLWCVLGSSLIPLACGVYQFFSQSGLSELGFNRIYGIFVHPAVFSQFLIGIFFITLYLVGVYRRDEWQKHFLRSFLAVVCAALVATFSRTSWIALCLGFFIYAFMRTRGSRKAYYLLIAVVVIALLMPVLGERFSDIHSSRPQRLSSWQWRLQQWKSTADTIGEHPFIGHGMGMYERTFRAMAHNDYLRISYEVGLGGLAVYLSILLFIAVRGLGALLRATDTLLQKRYKISLALVCVIAVISLADNLVRSTVVLLYFFICIGAFMGTAPGVKDENIVDQ